MALVPGMSTQPFSLCSPCPCLQGKANPVSCSLAKFMLVASKATPPPLNALRGGHAWVPSYLRQANWIRTPCSCCSMTECLTLSLATPTPRALQQEGWIQPDLAQRVKLSIPLPLSIQKPLISGQRRAPTLNKPSPILSQVWRLSSRIQRLRILL